MMKGDFTKRKFLALPLQQQHKKCAECLRQAYDELIRNSATKPSLEAYHELSLWMNTPSLEDNETKNLADRYHFHLKLAEVKHKEHHLLPAIRRGDKKTASPPWSIAIYLDQIRSAHNVGSILRTVEAFSLGSVYFSDDTPYIDNKQVNDAAMGTVPWLTCHRNISLHDLPKPIIAMETSSKAISLNDFIFPETFTLVGGNEEYGCSDHTLASADYLVEIPLRGHKNSLNVANAFAIAAAEIARQKSNLNHNQPPSPF